MKKILGCMMTGLLFIALASTAFAEGEVQYSGTLNLNGDVPSATTNGLDFTEVTGMA